MPVDEVTENFQSVGRLSCHTKDHVPDGQLNCTVTTYRDDESGVGADTAEVKVQNVITDKPDSAHREGSRSTWDFDWTDDSECIVQRMRSRKKRLVCES